jgi:hypothetical protein
MNANVRTNIQEDVVAIVTKFTFSACFAPKGVEVIVLLSLG